MGLEKLHRERAVDAVYQALRQAIVSCDLKPGERLNVDELARELGVSLTPVRGAIQQLATEGLVDIRPRSGTFVTSLTPQDVEETFKIRCALECLAAEDAMGNLTPQDLKRFKDLLRQLEKPVRSQAASEVHERHNTEFHQLILRASGNRRLQEMYDGLNAHIKIARIHASESGWAARLQEEQAEHESIVGGFESGDLGQVHAALRKHVYRAKDALVAALRAATGSQRREAAGK